MRMLSLPAAAAMALLAQSAIHRTAPTVLVSNLRDKAVVHSGFVVGTAASDASGISLVERTVDRGLTFQPATGADSWRFKLPTGANTWKDNSAHTIEVRATDSGGTV